MKLLNFLIDKLNYLCDVLTLVRLKCEDSDEFKIRFSASLFSWMICLMLLPLISYFTCNLLVILSIYQYVLGICAVVLTLVFIGVVKRDFVVYGGATDDR